MHLHNYLQTKPSALPQILYRSNLIWKVNGRFQFQKNLPVLVPKYTEGKFMFFDETNFQSRLIFTIWNLVFALALRILLKPLTNSFKKDTNTVKAASQLRCLSERKKLAFTLQMNKVALHLLVRT